MAIVLLVAFALPLLTPSLAYGADGSAGVAACCRRSGAHHCMSMGVATQDEPDGHAMHSLQVRCPHCPAMMQSAPHADTYAAGVAEAVFAGWVNYPCGAAQTESKRRISRDRARGKRGPPASMFL